MRPLFSALYWVRLESIPFHPMGAVAAEPQNCLAQSNSLPDIIRCDTYRSVSKSWCVFLSSLYCISLLIRSRIHKTSVHYGTSWKNRPAVPVLATSLRLFYVEDTELRARLFWLCRIVGKNVLLLRLLDVVLVVMCSTYHGLGVQRERSVLLREGNTNNVIKQHWDSWSRYNIIFVWFVISEVGRLCFLINN